MSIAWGERASYRYAFIFLALTAGTSCLPAAAQTAATPTLPEVTAAPTPSGSKASEASTDVYAPKGLPLGGFRLFPTLELMGAHDSNVFLSQTDTKSDFFFRETPQLMLRSDWSRHELDVYGAASLYQYNSFPDQDHVDWDAGGNGRIDIHQGIAFSGSGSYAIEHLANSSPDQPTNAKSPSQFSVTQSAATLQYNPYHFGFSLGGTFTRYLYDPTKLIDGSLVSNADRDENLYTASAKVSYEVSPGYAVFVQGIQNTGRYHLTFDRSGLRRDYDGYTANIGLDMLVTDLIRGQAFVGYLDQRFKAPFNAVSGLNYGANIDWFASPLWTLHLSASRTFNGTILATASAEDDRSVQLKADYRATPAIVLTGAVGYMVSKFDGSPRQDTYKTGQLMAAYHLNPWVSVVVSDTYQIRDSTIDGQNFNDNLVMLGLKFQE